MKHNRNYDNAPAPRTPDPQLVPVHFEFKDLKATTVCLAGTFNHWHRITMLDEGRIIATGTPKEMKANPHPRVQEFLNARIPPTLAASAHVLPNVSIPGREGKLPMPVAPDDEVREFGVAPTGHLHLATPAMAANGRKSG